MFNFIAIEFSIGKFRNLYNFEYKVHRIDTVINLQAKGEKNMKLKNLTKSLSVIFILLAMLFSCDQLTNENTDGNGNDTTQDGGNNQVGDNNSDNENGENNGNSGDNNEDENNTITVDEASKIIANLTSGTHDIKIAGAINIDTFASICSAIYAINENTSVKINLDLSKTTGLTEIPASAFGGRDNLLSIVIPDSVTTISNSAFMACKNLTFNVSENNKNYSSSDDGKILYNKDKTELIAYPSAIGDITIPDSVISIGDSAFQYCRSLTNITIGNNVITIGASAFYMCDSLTNIIIPDSVTTIRSSAFSWCDKLTEVTMGNNVTSIGSRAFYYCESLINIRIPDSVTSIGDRIFEGCSSLTSVTLGNNVTYISSNAFYECSNLIYNEYNNCLYLGNDNNPYLALMDSKYSDITSCEIDTNTKVIADGAFARCNNLTNINVSEDNENYYSSGTILFNKNKTKLIAYPSAMGDITIPEGVTSIGNGAFCYCDSLTSVTIPEDVTSIGESAFQYCRSLTNVSIGDSVTSIGSSAFYGCSSLTTVNYKGSQEQWEQISIGSSNEDLTNATINYNYTGE